MPCRAEPFIGERENQGGYWPKTRNKYYYKLNHAGGEDKNLFPGFFFREESVIFACKKTNKD